MAAKHKDIFRSELSTSSISIQDNDCASTFFGAEDPNTRAQTTGLSRLTNTRLYAQQFWRSPGNTSTPHFLNALPASKNESCSPRKLVEPHLKMADMSKEHRRIIIHFDYDCFYASVFEQENPALKDLPFAVQQKQIIVTCNYEARRRGLRKLQLITEAKEQVPDLIIALGEDLTRFRDASKLLYKYLESFTWSGRVERLGFDEVFMDVTDVIDFNRTLLNPNDLEHSFFQLKSDDPTVGFAFDGTRIAGHTFPDSDIHSAISSISVAEDDRELMLRLVLGSHLAQHLRWSLEEHRGYTSTVGIATNKLLSKLVGNLNKPKGQTTLVPPYVDNSLHDSSITTFLDTHDIGKIPGIGFKSAQLIRNYVLSRPADFEMGLIYGGTKENVQVRDVRTFNGMSAKLLEEVVGGPGVEKGIGGKVWGLINGNDPTEVQQMKKVPTQISIEDSYIKLVTMTEVLRELNILATSLLKRMHADLMEDDDDPDNAEGKRWIARPRTLRLSTRPRPPLNADGTRTRTFNRISKSGPLPGFVFNLKDSPEPIVTKLVQKALVPMFRQLHPQHSGWNLSLVNVCVTNMIESATEDGKGSGRDIGRMFKRQDEVLKEWKVEDRDVPPDSVPLRQEQTEQNSGVDQQQRQEPSAGPDAEELMGGSEDIITHTQGTTVEETGGWDDEEDEEDNWERCRECGATMPAFAMAAHERFHDDGEI